MWEIFPKISKKIYKEIVYMKEKWVESGISTHFLAYMTHFLPQNKDVS